MDVVRSILALLAATLLLAACGSGEQAQLQAAEGVYRRGNFKAAAETFQALADKGNARAQFFLGEMYLSGSGLPRDYALALKWATAGAEQKNTDAQYTLGKIYESGLGVPQDYVQAHMWYSLSASSGDEQAIRKKAELELKKMSGDQIGRSKQLELAWIDAHRAPR